MGACVPVVGAALCGGVRLRPGGARSTGATVSGDVRAFVLPLRLLGPLPAFGARAPWAPRADGTLAPGVGLAVRTLIHLRLGGAALCGGVRLRPGGGPLDWGVCGVFVPDVVAALGWGAPAAGRGPARLGRPCVETCGLSFCLYVFSGPLPAFGARAPWASWADGTRWRRGWGWLRAW